VRITWAIAALTAATSACGGTKSGDATADSSTATATVAQDSARSTGSPAREAGTASDRSEQDTDRTAGGSGVPTGYIGVTDKPGAKISDAKYTASGDGWIVRTGPAHILYSPREVGSGEYQVSATVEQLEKPTHPEAFGIFFGGSHLDDPAQMKYGYFLVRGGGEYLIKVRDGARTTDVVPWKASAAVPKQDASGKASYKLTVHFAKDTAHFLVNDKLVSAVPRAAVPSEGIAGLRVNHNLHVKVTRVEIER
jgi:hypothetical protein